MTAAGVSGVAVGYGGGVAAVLQAIANNKRVANIGNVTNHLSLLIIIILPFKILDFLIGIPTVEPREIKPLRPPCRDFLRCYADHGTE